jgi:hypothetical protein
MNPTRVRWGITLILIGLVFLANNLGGLSWWVWYDLMRLWPVLLIVIGLEIIVKRSKLQVLGYLSSVLVIATFAYVIYDNRDGNDDGYGSFPSSRSEAVAKYAGESAADIKVKFDNGRLYFNTGDSSELFRAVAENSRRGIHMSSDCSGTSCKVDLTPSGKRWGNWVTIGSYENHWKCFVRPEVASSYNLDIDNTDLRFFAQELKIDKLTINADHSDLVVRMGKQQAHADVDVTGGNSDLDIYFPDSTGLRIEGTYPSQTESDALKLTDRGGYLANDLYERAPVTFTVKSDLGRGRLRVSSY